MPWLKATDIWSLTSLMPDSEQPSEPPGEHGLDFLVLSEKHFTLHKLNIYGHLITQKGYESSNQGLWFVLHTLQHILASWL